MRTLLVSVWSLSACLAITGCSSSESSESTGDAANDVQGGDTQTLDSGATKDTATTTDSGSSTDSGSADTGGADTTVADSGAGDTATADATDGDGCSPTPDDPKRGTTCTSPSDCPAGYDCRTSFGTGTTCEITCTTATQACVCPSGLGCEIPAGSATGICS